MMLQNLWMLLKTAAKMSQSPTMIAKWETCSQSQKKTTSSKNTETTNSLFNWRSQRFTISSCQASTCTTASPSPGPETGREDLSIVSPSLTWLCNTSPLQTLCFQARTTFTHLRFWLLLVGFGLIPSWSCGLLTRSLLPSTSTSVFCQWSCTPSA